MEVWSFRREILQRKKIKVGSFCSLMPKGAANRSRGALVESSSVFPRETTKMKESPPQSGGSDSSAMNRMKEFAPYSFEPYPPQEFHWRTASVTTKRVLEASTAPAANNREVTEGERPVRVCNNEFFNGPNLPRGDLSFGSIYKLRIVVAEALQKKSDERSLDLPHSKGRHGELRFILSGLLVESREHSLYDPPCAVFEIHHGVKL